MSGDCLHDEVLETLNSCCFTYLTLFTVPVEVIVTPFLDVSGNYRHIYIYICIHS